MALPTWVAAGTMTGSASTLTPTMPAGFQANDILILVCQSVFNETVSLSTANGFAETPSSPQNANIAGGTRLTCFWKRAVGSDAAPIIADPGDHVVAVICAVRGVKTSGNPWNITSGNNSTAQNTAVSISGETTTAANCLVVAITTDHANNSSSARYSAWANADLANVTERVDGGVQNAGVGGGIGIATGEKAAAGVYGTTTATVFGLLDEADMTLALEGVVGAGFPNTSVVDSFTRANESPAGNGNWSGPTENAAAQLAVVSNKLTSNSPGNAGFSYWLTQFAADQECFATVGALGTNTGRSGAVWARIQNPNNATTAAGYSVNACGGASNIGARVQVWKLTAGHTYTQLGADIAQVTTAGDMIGISVAGSVITAWYKAGAGAWTAIGNRTDSTVSGAGFIGAECDDQTYILDDFGGGVATGRAGTAAITGGAAVLAAVVSKAIASGALTTHGGGTDVAADRKNAVASRTYT